MGRGVAAKVEGEELFKMGRFINKHSYSIIVNSSSAVLIAESVLQ